MKGSLQLRSFLWGGLCCLVIGEACAQPHAGAWAWRPLLTHEGIVFSYLFYRQADNENDGVVLKLDNTNAFAVQYRFRVVFRTEGAVHEEAVSGRLNPHEVKTGDAAGLFWIPFKDGRSIGEIGLRGFNVVPDAGERVRTTATGHGK